MAKALYGHLGGPDPAIAAEMAHLRRRVRDLIDEVDRLTAANDALTSLVAADHLAGIDRVVLPSEPADVSVPAAGSLTRV